MLVMAREAAFSTWKTARAWSPTGLYLLVSGVWLVVVAGVVGFIYNSDFAIDTRPGSSSDIFGILETNGWHNLAGLGLGVASLAFAVRPERARFGALSLGAAMVITTIALMIWDPRTFGLASNDEDQVLHALAGIGGIAAALATRSAPISEAPDERATLAM